MPQKKFHPKKIFGGEIFLGGRKSVQDGPRNLRLKFGQNRVSNSWDIADVEFSVVVVGGGEKSFLCKTQT